MLCVALGASACAGHRDPTTLRPPAALTAAPPKVLGLNKSALDGIAEDIRKGDFGNTHALLVARGGHGLGLGRAAYLHRAPA